MPEIRIGTYCDKCCQVICKCSKNNNPMNQYKTGDTVRIWEDLEVGKTYGETYLGKCDFIESMEQYKGKIAEVIDVGEYYLLDIDEGFWGWPAEMLRPVVQQEEKIDDTTLKDEYEQAEKRGGAAYADAYIEGLKDGSKYYSEQLHPFPAPSEAQGEEVWTVKKKYFDRTVITNGSKTLVIEDSSTADFIITELNRLRVENVELRRDGKRYRDLYNTIDKLYLKTSTERNNFYNKLTASQQEVESLISEKWDLTEEKNSLHRTISDLTEKLAAAQAGLTEQELPEFMDWAEDKGYTVLSGKIALVESSNPVKYKEVEPSEVLHAFRTHQNQQG